MIQATDKEYLNTKEIMLGRSTMDNKWLPLVNWIEQEYGARPINVFYREDKGMPVLELCFEKVEEAQMLMDEDKMNWDKTKQKAIAQHYSAIYSGRDSDALATENETDAIGDIYVMSSDFQSIAMDEAANNIRQDELEELRDRLGKDIIWKILPSRKAVEFMLYDDEQVSKYNVGSYKREWLEQYLALISRYDKFQYCDTDSINIYLTSKTSFDRDYDGDWHTYLK